MSATIKDIALLAGVSHTTVSRALNGSPLIHPDTRDRIVALAEQLQYTPNRNARSLVHGRSNTIGVFFSTLDQGTSPNFFYRAVQGASSVLQNRYHVVVRAIDACPDTREITAKTFDGVLVMSQSEQDDPFIRHLEEQDIPHVVMNREPPGGRSAAVVSGDRQGARELTVHLLALGHTEIGLLKGKAGFSATAERRAGYVKALHEGGVTCRTDYEVEGRFDAASGYAGMQRLLGLDRRPTAVFCMNDEMALGALKAALDAGIRVPEELSLAGFDDNGLSAYASPSLTTVSRPVVRMSREGASLLLELLESGSTMARTVRVPTKLVVRHSTGRLTPLAER